MPTFTRHVEPARVGSLQFPGPLTSWSHTGKAQLRSTQQVGVTWEESYPPLNVTDDLVQKFFAMVNNFWRNGTTFDIAHKHHLVHRGGGSGTPLIAGGSQTGVSLATDGWGGSDPVLRAGDIFRIAGIPNVMQMVEDAPNLSGGATSLSINPPLFAGGSPGDNVALTYTGVVIQAVLVERPNISEAEPNAHVMGVHLSFREMP